MAYFHDTLLRYNFIQQREGFYKRPTSPAAGGTLYCGIGDGGRPRQLLLWQAQRVLLQGDVVTLEALQQVLDRVLRRETPAKDIAG
jgi:hypothetical protein